MNSGEKVAMRNYFESLPVYSEYFDEAIDAIIAAMDSGIHAEKGRVLHELGATNKDFWFLKDGFLKEMYRSPYSNEDSLFNMIPPSSIFVNEDTLFANRRPQHYFVGIYERRDFKAQGSRVSEASSTVSNLDQSIIHKRYSGDSKAVDEKG